MVDRVRSAPGPRGQLVVIGGAESRTEGILREFVRLCGGPDADIAIVATASGEPGEVEAEYIDAFTALGATHAHAVSIRSRADANSEQIAASMGCCTGVFFTGGDQRRIAAIIGGSLVDQVLHRRVGAGEVVLAGTSAGAAMMSATMILGGTDAGVGTNAVQTGPGLEFLPGVLIDMHFAERGRLNRLLSAIGLYPHELGLGIDEDTAIVVDRGCFEVIGAGSVTVIDAGQASMIELPVDGDGPIVLSGVRLHVLPSGHRFDLTGREPTTSPPGFRHHRQDTQDRGASV
ncbi:cyanophycinase [Pilimelia columellifera]|uniref:Cyanophycinase n=1 Tax=Pilimelia columellifera subsp. columellifera TaxID=706583 RepID=A0ABN3N9P9_9ACTN